MRKRLLTEIGRTDDGRPVIGGFHKLLESQGIPLQEFLLHCQSVGWVPSWPDYIESALAMRWNLSTALSKAEEAVVDVFGKDYAREWMLRMKLYVASRSTAENPC